MRKKLIMPAIALMVFAAPLAAQGRGAAGAGANRGPAEVPPGHRPPAGMCRVWIDGVPPGKQPAVTDCVTAVATRPANGRVIYGDQTPFPGKGKAAEGTGRRTQDGRVIPWPVSTDTATTSRGRGKGRKPGG